MKDALILACWEEGIDVEPLFPSLLLFYSSLPKELNSSSVLFRNPYAYLTTNFSH